MKKFIELLETTVLFIIILATAYAVGSEVWTMIVKQTVDLGDLLLLFIYAEVIGMVGIFIRSRRIPITLPIIIAITSLGRLISLQSKEIDPEFILYESLGVLFLAIAVYILAHFQMFKIKVAEARPKHETRGIDFE